MFRVKSWDISKILIQDLLIVHAMIGYTSLMLLLVSWQVSSLGLVYITLYYALLVFGIYIPLYILAPKILVKPLVAWSSRYQEDHHFLINDIMSLIKIARRTALMFRITQSIVVFLAYGITAYLFANGLIPELHVEPLAIVYASLCFGVIISVLETVLDDARIQLYLNNVVQRYVDLITLDYPQALLKNRSSSLQVFLQAVLIITNVVSVLVVAVYFFGIVMVYIPEFSMRSIIFTFVLIGCTAGFIALIGNRVFELIYAPLQATESWLSDITDGKFVQSVPYATYAEFVPTLHHINELREQISKKTKSLEDERDNLNNILKRISDGVVVMRVGGAILYLNAAAREILEIDVTLRTIRMSGNMIFRPVENQKSTKITSWHSLLTNELKNEQVYFYTSAGEKRLLEISSERLISQQEAPAYLITFADITKDAELEQMKADFVSIAAHELRTPLTSVRNYLALLEEESTDKLDSDSKMYLERTRTSAEQLAEIVESFLTASRIERNVIELHKSTFNWSAAISELVEKLRPLAKQKGLTLTLQLPTEEIQLTADHDRMVEVMGNLIDNAIKYSIRGEIVISSNVDNLSHTLYISIKDNGIGIPLHEQIKLFTKFYRASNANHSEIKGTGIGLYVVKTLIELHKGKIWVESEENKGTTFHISLPMR